MQNMRKYIILAIIITLLLPAYSFAVPKLMKNPETDSSAARDVAPRATPHETQPATQPTQPATQAATQPVVSTGGHIYIAESGPATADGKSCSSAHPVSWLNTPSNWGNGDKQVGAGDTVHLCGVISQRVLILGSGVSGSPITIKFEPGAKLSSEAWDATYGAIYALGRQYIIVDGAGGKIENTANGTTLSKHVRSVGLVFNNCQNIEIKNLIVSNIYQRTPGSSDSNKFGAGITLLDSSNSSVHDCTVDNAYVGIANGFTIEKSSNVSIYNNSISKTSTGIQVGSGYTNTAAQNIAIYNNKIYDNYVWDGRWTTSTGQTDWHHNCGIHGWAVHTGSSINGLNIYNNEIGANLGTNLTGWIYIERRKDKTANVSNVNVYNNLLTNVSPSGPTAFIDLSGINGGTIYNNTIAAAGKGMGVFITQNSNAIDIKNNIFYKVNGGIGVDVGSEIGSSNCNAFYGISSGYVGGYQTKNYTLANWQSVLGFDRDSIGADPLLSPTYIPAPNSPVRGKGQNLGGTFIKDKKGVTRPAGAWTIGAYQ